jgi:1,4-alpha-glucan branching enzyme
MLVIKKKADRTSGEIKVTFVVPDGDPRLPASVVGDFNSWDRRSNPLRKRSNGTWSAVVSLPPGQRFEFRYRSEDGTWFDEPDADGKQAGGFGVTNCVVLT